VFVLSATTMFRPSLTAAANAPMQQHAIHALSVRAPMSSLSQIPSWRSRHVNATFVRDLVRRDAANAAARATMIATMMMRAHARATIGSDGVAVLIAPPSQQLSFNWYCLWNSCAALARVVCGKSCAMTCDSAASLRDRRSIFFRSDAARRLA
jgi:hypothetical protein